MLPTFHFEPLIIQKFVSPFLCLFTFQQYVYLVLTYDLKRTDRCWSKNIPEKIRTKTWPMKMTLFQTLIPTLNCKHYFFSIQNCECLTCSSKRDFSCLSPLFSSWVFWWASFSALSCLTSPSLSCCNRLQSSGLVLLDRSTKKFTLCLNLHSTQVGTLNFIFDTTVRRHGSLNSYKAHIKSTVSYLSHK